MTIKPKTSEISAKSKPNFWVLSAREYLILGLITCGVLMVPLVAMQFTSEVNWDVTDFLLAGILVFSAAHLILTLTQLTKNQLIKYLLVMTVLTLLMLIWAQLAVGLI